MKLVLGSASKSRQELIATLGVPFEVMTADIDEKAIRFPDPKELVLAIANAKADALLSKITEPSLLVTCDSVVACHDEIFEKPSTKDEARAFLRAYLTQPAECVTAVVVTNTQTGQRASGVDVATVFFKSFSDEAIEAMIENGRAMDCAGAFNISDPEVLPYVDYIEGTEESVSGLPLALVKELLEKVSISNLE